MVVKDDIVRLWEMRDDRYAVMVVKHDYKTKHPVKYLGAKNEDYPCKNWSSVILWNCEHPSNALLTPAFVESSSGAFLHRFQWLTNDEIGDLPIDWNWLAEEYDHLDNPSLIHYTVGTPCFKEYSRCDYAEDWYQEFHDMNYSEDYIPKH